MASHFPGLSGLLVRCTAAVAALVVLASCGGGVSAPQEPPPLTPISITPAEATLFSEVPTEFLVTGGNGQYFVSSSNQSAVPSPGAFTGNIFTIVPSAVAADTPVILTVRDTSTTIPATAALVVKPRTVSNAVTITPSSSVCGTALCAGGDAEVRVTLSQAGVPLVGRQVRLDIVSGDVRIITSPAGVPEQVAVTSTAPTDSSGIARFRIRALSDVTSQTAILRMTDVSSGFVQTTSVNVNPGGVAALDAQPDKIDFLGSDFINCANNVPADVIVFGGRPPYQVSQPTGFRVTPLLVRNSGDRFTVTPQGICVASATIAVVDSSGATVQVALSNKPAAAPATPFAVSPDTVTLTSCVDRATVIVVGGSGNYFFASSTLAIDVRPGGTGTFVIQRRRFPPPIEPTATVAFSDGRTSEEVTVNLSGQAQDSECDFF